MKNLIKTGMTLVNGMFGLLFASISVSYLLSSIGLKDLYYLMEDTEWVSTVGEYGIYWAIFIWSWYFVVALVKESLKKS